MSVAYILKRNNYATFLNPLFLPHGPHDDNFLISDTSFEPVCESDLCKFEARSGGGSRAEG